MKKVIIISAVLTLIVLLMVGCTPDEQENNPTNTLPLINSSTTEQISSKPGETLLETRETVAESTIVSGNESTEAEYTTAAPDVTTEEPEEEIPESYVIDVGGNVGIGGN